MTVYAGQFGPESIEYSDGKHARLVRISILNGDGSPAKLWNDRVKTAEAANPVATDGLGNLLFFADPGRYVAVINGARLPITVHKDPDEPEAELLQSYKHTQATIELNWVVVHPLSFQPAACRVQYENETVQRLVPVEHVGTDTVIVRNGAPARGTAILS